MSSLAQIARHQSDSHLVNTIRERQMRVEHSINFVRMAILGVAISLDFFTALDQRVVTQGYELFMGLVSSLCVIYVVFVHVMSRGHRYRDWLKYLIITMDNVLVLLYFEEMRTPEVIARLSLDSGVSVSVMILLVIVTLSAVRLSDMAVIYSTILATAVTLFFVMDFSADPLSRIWYPPVVVIVGGVTYWISRNLRSIVRALWRREKLARFLPRELVQMVESSDVDLSLGGKAITATILFADIRNFTAFSEMRDPEEVVEVLNNFFSAMTTIIHDHGGMIDKYIGDAIMAVFGAPIARDGDASRAVAAASEMLKRLTLLNAEWQNDGKPPLRMGIALHTGIVIAGNIGSPSRMDYTVVGDAVNLASRLEELNKKYQTELLLSEETLKASGNGEHSSFLGESEVRGRERRVRLYTMGSPGKN